MALNIGDNFSYAGAKPLDNRRVFASKAAMDAVNLSTVYNGMVAYAKAEDKYYRLKDGVWVEFSSGSGGVSDWKENTVYAKNDMVVNGDKLYLCITAHTSGASFDTTEQANWQEVGSGGAGITAWSTNTKYAVGDIVYYANSLYKCETAHTSSAFNTDLSKWSIVFADIKPWAVSTFYPIGVVVINSNKLYQCKTEHTSSTSFSDANWNLIASNFCIDAWESGIVYEVGNFVTHDGVLYKCKISHTSSAFDTDISNWEDIKANIRDWDSGLFYNVGDTVIYGSAIYKALASHTSTSTFDTEKWELICSSTSAIDFWKKSYDYSINDLVLVEDKLYRCVTSHKSDSTDFSNDADKWKLITELKSWTVNTKYIAGEMLEHNSVIYKVDTTFTSGSTFSDTDLSFLKVVLSSDSKNILEYKSDGLFCNGESVFLADWASNIEYKLNQIIYNNGSIYKCVTSHTSGSTFTDTNWELVYSDIKEWSASTYYSEGAVVIKSNKLYKCKTANSDSTFTEANWQKIGDSVFSGATTSSNGSSGLVPQPMKDDREKFLCGNGTWKTVASDSAITLWVTSKDYSVNDIVVNNGILYKCLEAHTSTVFATDLEADKWKLFGTASSDIIIVPEWAGEKSYSVNTMVVHGDGVYMCVVSHTSSNDFEGDVLSGYWTKMGSKSSSSSSFGYMQSTQLGVVGTSSSPFVVTLPINRTLTYCLPPIEVLEMTASVLNQTITIDSMDSSDKSKFVHNSKYLTFDGSLKMNTNYTLTMGTPEPLEDFYVSESEIIDVSEWLSLEEVE